MGPDFHDIDIPPRMTEYALPLDTAIKFVFVEEPAGLQLSIFSAGRERKYGGRGRICWQMAFLEYRNCLCSNPFLLDKRTHSRPRF